MARFELFLEVHLYPLQTLYIVNFFLAPKMTAAAVLHTKKCDVSVNVIFILHHGIVNIYTQCLYRFDAAPFKSLSSISRETKIER